MQKNDQNVTTVKKNVCVDPKNGMCYVGRKYSNEKYLVTVKVTETEGK